MYPRQDRRVPRISSRAARARRARRTPPCSAKRKQLEEFIAKNKARASTATRARSQEQATRKAGTDRHRRRRADGPHSRAAWSSRARARRCAAAIWRSAIPSGEIADGHRSRNRSRLAGRDRRRQRPRQDDVPAHDRRFARTARRRSPLGPRLPDRHLRPARLHEPAREADGARVSGVPRAAPGTKTQEILDLAGALLFRGER